MSLACIFNNRDPVVVGDLLNSVHLRYLPVQIDRNNRTGSARDCRLEQIWIHRESDRINIDEDRSRAHCRDCLSSCDKCMRDRDDFVTGANFEGPPMQDGAPRVPVFTATQ